MITPETAKKLLEALRQSSAAMNELTFVPLVPDLVMDKIWNARVANRAAIKQAEEELND